MSTPALRPSLPIGDQEPRVDRIADRVLTEISGMTIVSLASRRGRDSDLNRRAKMFLGAELPAPGAMIESSSWMAYWSGPSRWMLMTSSYERVAALEHVYQAVSDAASITDQSDGMALFTLEGDRLGKLLRRLCDIDVDRMFGGQAHRTVLEHVSVTMLVHSQRLLTVLVPRSYVMSVRDILIATARATSP